MLKPLAVGILSHLTVAVPHVENGSSRWMFVAKDCQILVQNDTWMFDGQMMSNPQGGITFKKEICRKLRAGQQNSP